jgi:pantetheine-phosphate adenylyltransferase
MKVGVYAGSFNPFHLGHYNILTKAEKIFDKVIIGFGKNSEKSDNFGLLSQSLDSRDVRFYDGLLTDFIDSLEYENITLIRGLRNSTDLQYELTQYRFLQELKPDIQVISIFCDKEYEHISSSAIRMLMKYGKGLEYILK